MSINFSVVIKNVETDSDYNIDMRRLEDKEVFVLILKDKLVDKRILLQAFKSFGQLLHIEVTTSVL